MAARILFDRDGRYLLGRHKGTHVSKLDKGFVQWASMNVDGFEKQYEIFSQDLEPKKQEKAQPTGRSYTIHKTKRRYAP